MTIPVINPSVLLPAIPSQPRCYSRHYPCSLSLDTAAIPTLLPNAPVSVPSPAISSVSKSIVKHIAQARHKRAPP